MSADTPTPSEKTKLSPAEELRQRMDVARRGGHEKYHIRLHEAGKLFVRERLDRLLDPGTMVEEGLLARCVDGDLAADAVVTVTGKIGGRPVAIMANDMTVKAGAWGRLTIQKIQRIQEIARDAEIPMLYLVDSAGARLDEQFDIFINRTHAGRIFHNQILLSGVVPQICVLFGPSPAGSAYIPAFCDLVIMVDGHASAYLGSPRMSEMATGEKVTMEEMGGARMHCSVSGLGDVLVAGEEEALAVLTRHLTYMPRCWRESPAPVVSRPPAEGKPIDELIPPEQNRVFDMQRVIDRLVDEGSFFEIKRLFAPELITGLARLDGRVIGVLANQPKVKGGVLFGDSSDKGARFVWLCNAFNIPLLFLADVPGFMIGSQVERQGIIRHGAKLLFAIAEATVPKISVIVRKAYGAGYMAMNGGSFLPDACIALPTAKLAIMGPEAAVNAIHLNTIMALEGEARAAFIKEKRREYEEQIDIYRIASEFFIDAVVPGTSLREELCRRFETFAQKPRRPVRRWNGVIPG
jgi:acetyl-CoA carboxylase carboxyltransferase component